MASSYRNFTHNSNFFFGTNLFGEETLYSIQECNLPGLSFSHIQSQTNSTFLNFQGDTLSFNDLTVNIIVDENLVVWKEIVNALFKMREQETGTGEELQEMSWLEIQDDNTNIVLKLFFYGCMIESIGDMEFNSNQEDEIITIPVSIKYDYYEIA